jgi:hypothetical protein
MGSGLNRTIMLWFMRSWTFGNLMCTGRIKRNTVLRIRLGLAEVTQE